MLYFRYFQLLKPPHYFRTRDRERDRSLKLLCLYSSDSYSVFWLVLELPDLDFFILSAVNIRHCLSDLVLYNDLCLKKKKSLFPLWSQVFLCLPWMLIFSLSPGHLLLLYLRWMAHLQLCRGIWTNEKRMC